MAEEPKDGPPGWVWDGGTWQPPSIGANPHGRGPGRGGEEQTPIGRNRKPVKDKQAPVAAAARELGFESVEAYRAWLEDDSSVADEESPAEKALTAAALEVAGIDLFTYGEQALPHWVPQELRPHLTAGSELTGRYDPYLGRLDDPGDDRVYMGAEMARPKGGVSAPEGLTPSEARAAGVDHNDFPKKRKRDQTLTLTQAQNLPYTWEDEEVAEVMKRLRRAGINVRNFDELKAVWDSLVDRASKSYTLSLGKRKLTPWDVLELTRREAEETGSLVNYEDGTQTRTATSVSEISEGASWATLRTTLSALLGRDPTDREVRDYAYRMNTLAAKNPSITETITRYEAGEAVSQESSKTGGFDADDMAREAYDQAQDDPEYAKVQAGTTYFNALLQGLGAIGD